MYVFHKHGEICQINDVLDLIKLFAFFMLFLCYTAFTTFLLNKRKHFLMDADKTISN